MSSETLSPGFSSCNKGEYLTYDLSASVGVLVSYTSLSYSVLKGRFRWWSLHDAVNLERFESYFEGA